MGLGEGQGAASLGECWSTDPDLANRDPNNLNDHLAVSINLKRFLKFQKKLKDYFRRIMLTANTSNNEVTIERDFMTL